MRMNFDYERMNKDYKLFYIRGRVRVGLGIYIESHRNDVEIKIGFLFYRLEIGVIELPF